MKSNYIGVWLHWYYWKQHYLLVRTFSYCFFNYQSVVINHVCSKLCLPLFN